MILCSLCLPQFPQVTFIFHGSPLAPYRSSWHPCSPHYYLEYLKYTVVPNLEMHSPNNLQTTWTAELGPNDMKKPVSIP